MAISGPRGTRDILPDSSGWWQYIEAVARDVCRLYNYREIRTPIFEHTELFLRGIGETTDIVQKEMYTFQDRGGRSITLRPENTAAVVRAFLEHKLYADTMPTKLFYIGPMFRYDRPQAGRLRQFHQFGVEAIGAPGPIVDAEIIVLAMQFFQRLGLTDLALHINSVGCPACRPVYRQKLQAALRDKLPELCADCQSRFERNPMRILDCKNERCQALSQDVPSLTDCLCSECHQHFETLKELLRAANISFHHDPRLVRGLDYYTKTAFEIQYAPLGAQSAICGGGRYDGLVEECGGPPTPGIGFAIGLERVLLALEKQGLMFDTVSRLDVFVAPLGQAVPQAFAVVSRLRQAGFSCEIDLLNRSLKAQLKQANKLAARYVVMIGEDEVRTNQVLLKDMNSGEQQLIDIAAVHTKLAEMRDKDGDNGRTNPN